MADATPKRILVVDDASLVRLYYRTALEGAGFQVEEALNGLEALEKLLTAHFDLLIVDINMPQMDGLTFLQTVRGKSLPLASIPALVTSTESAAADRGGSRGRGELLPGQADQPGNAGGVRLLLCGVRHERVPRSSS